MDAALIGLLAALFVAGIVLAAAEASLLRVRRVRVEVLADEGDVRARLLRSLLGEIQQVLNAILLAVLLTQIGAATVTGMLVDRHFGSVGVTVGSIVLTVVLFVYSESIPKTYAVHHPEQVALALALPMRLVSGALRYPVAALVWFADLQAPGRGLARRYGVSEAELRRLAREARAGGHIEESDLRLIERAFRLGDRDVEEIMVGRPDVVALAAGTPVREALDLAIADGHRRLPVYRDSLDEITGVAHLRDIAAAIAAGREGTVGDLASPVLAVPEIKRVVDLLGDMQESGVHLAVVVDEHGGTAGIVTIEDVVAEMFGDVSGASGPVIEQLAPDRWRVDGAVDIADFVEEIGVALPRGDWGTVAGLVTALAGRIPRPGEQVEAPGVAFTVRAGTARRVLAVDVERTSEVPGSEGSAG